ncbi:carbohydrate-binding protein [Chondromyces apiculatus]|uniref:Glycogen-binding regulatory subunit of S/T protein phosphatase I n=1 Tax=Chondromyces apiculatus DSM 436 TaxID=1192034 RepID=A0A017T0U9_9BACT|nr:carbohydrate-binding protein [Chondromyces apiculatus]EYF02176.1 Glycogen-binding regulatory subunit of S/T protein phosphatase I [Chondromyces apiculatus DSM 436]
MRTTKMSGRMITPHTFGEAFERAVAAVRQTGRGVLRSGAVAGAMVLAAGPGVTGCLAEAGDEATLAIGDLDLAEQDWAQYEGQRNTAMVTYEKSHWHNYTGCGSRMGCTGVDVFVKLRVKPVAGANLDNKRVGIIYKSGGQGTEVTATGYYFSTRSNGDEEWHVKVSLPSYVQQVFTFNAWYQDGAGHTYYDDNSGELHVANYGATSTVIYRDTSIPDLTLTSAGLQGTLKANIADLDYDKSVVVRWTTDGWQTFTDTPLAFDADLGSLNEKWAVTFNVAGDFQQVQYAIVYRHGVVNGADVYEFWDSNNGANYTVNRQ